MRARISGHIRILYDTGKENNKKRSRAQCAKYPKYPKIPITSQNDHTRQTKQPKSEICEC
jgi:hypothetical protein